MPQLIIDSKQTINSAQKQFNDVFSFLKIEFFKEPHIAGKGTAKNKMIVSNVPLSQIQNKKKQGKVTFDNTTTVGQFEKNFEETFGLYVQVFRKSGKIWLETSETDNWTLFQQNEEGKSLEQHFKMEKEDPNDHDIY